MEPVGETLFLRIDGDDYCRIAVDGAGDLWVAAGVSLHHRMRSMGHHADFDPTALRAYLAGRDVPCELIGRCLSQASE